MRVGVWGEPDPAAPTLAGAAVRSLVLPQLHVARPGGRWEASLLQPGSEREGDNHRSATFRLRPRARWSDGRPISAADLRRSADRRFVAAVEGPTDDGRITIRFTQPLPGWRRLWSGADSVAPPAANVWGGPFVVVERVPGLRTTLRPNPRWWGRPPFIGELRLVLVPDGNTALRLFEEKRLDVISPLAATNRTTELNALDRASVDRSGAGGWWVGLLLNPDRLDGAERRGMVATVDRRQFVGSLLKDEARVLDGFAGVRDRTWAAAGPGQPEGLEGEEVDFVGTLEEPMTALLQRSMQRRARVVDGTLELRTAESDLVEPWVTAGDFDAAVVIAADPPQPCWTCRWADAVGEDLTRAADRGDSGAVAELQGRLRDEAIVLPLWRPITAVAWRDGLKGPQANGFALSPAWNAERWFFENS